MDKKQALDAHQANVAGIQRRGVHDRTVSKLHYWKALECNGYVLADEDTREVVMLTLNLANVRAEMTAAGQAPGDDALLALLGLS